MKRKTASDSNQSAQKKARPTIRSLIQKAGSPEDATVIEKISAIQKGLGKKKRRQLIDAALTNYFNSEFLKPYQAELIKLLQLLLLVRKNRYSMGTDQKRSR